MSRRNGSCITATTGISTPGAIGNRPCARSRSDAIDEATVLEQPAIEVKDETLDRHLTSGYGIFAGVHTQEAVLLFNATRARWVATEVWHPQQDGKLQLYGGYLLKLPYSREPELVMDILKYGADVEVLSPESLRTAVANQLRDAARLYERKR
jgi:predicted DNA-binding transcriptional regulator YafY